MVTVGLQGGQQVIQEGERGFHDSNSVVVKGAQAHARR